MSRVPWVRPWYLHLEPSTAGRGPVWALAPLLPFDLGPAPPTLGLVVSTSTRRVASHAHSEFLLRRE